MPHTPYKPQFGDVVAATVLHDGMSYEGVTLVYVPEDEADSSPWMIDPAHKAPGMDRYYRPADILITSHPGTPAAPAPVEGDATTGPTAVLLRMAADRLEALYKEATPGPWVSLLAGHSFVVAHPVDECTCRMRGRPGDGHAEHCGHDGIFWQGRHGDAGLVVALRQVAVPLAEWLRAEERMADQSDNDPYGESVDVARAVLGEATFGE
jgi:hypothetical protein